MKAKYQLVISIILLASFVCCGRYLTSSPGSLFTIDYLLKRDGYVIPDSLYSFFPSDSNTLKLLECKMISQNADKHLDLHVDGFTPFSIVELYETKNISAVREITDRYLPKALSVVDAGDTSYNALMAHYLVYNKYHVLSIKDLYNPDDPIVPYFDVVKEQCGMGCEETKCELVPGTKIITLMSGNDCLLDSPYRYEELELPQNMRHGYRSGIAAHPDSCYIFYWTIIW